MFNVCISHPCTVVLFDRILVYQKWLDYTYLPFVLFFKGRKPRLVQYSERHQLNVITLTHAVVVFFYKCNWNNSFNQLQMSALGFMNVLPFCCMLACVLCYCHVHTWKNGAKLLLPLVTLTLLCTKNCSTRRKWLAHFEGESVAVGPRNTHPIIHIPYLSPTNGANCQLSLVVIDDAFDGKSVRLNQFSPASGSVSLVPMLIIMAS